MDFETLLSRQYAQAASITRLVPREKYIPQQHNQQQRHNNNNSNNNNTNMKGSNRSITMNGNNDGTYTSNNIDQSNTTDSNHDDNEDTNDTEIIFQQQQKDMNNISRQIVLDLVSHTSTYQRHMMITYDNNNNNNDPSVTTTKSTNIGSMKQLEIDSNVIKRDMLLLTESSSSDVVGGETTTVTTNNRSRRGGIVTPPMIESKYHEIELGDWESNIIWDVSKLPKNDINTSNNNNNTSTTMSNDESNPTNTKNDRESSVAVINRKKFDPISLLEKKRNHLLDTIEFDNNTILWDASDTKKIEQMSKAVPLILEYGVAGQSVARSIYHNMNINTQHPIPALKSDTYRNRLDRDWAQNSNSTTELSTTTTTIVNSDGTITTKSSLHVDKEKEAKIIAARQKKRAQMAEDKTSRVAEAMGTMSIGGGRGRTVTSSLMGPGGTERTGRPSRAINTGIHETEYVEQLDLIITHALVRNDVSKIILRQYMRPKLPLSVVRDGLSWQFQILYNSNNSGKSSGSNHPNGTRSDGQGTATASYQSIMLGAQHHTPGAISRERLRTEADLSPTEGMLVVLEYVEERLPIQLSKGMCSKIINYYRDSDKTRCPVSAGGGDRPARRKRSTITGTGNNSTTAGNNLNESNNQNRNGKSKIDRLLKLEGPDRHTTITDWVGVVPKKSSKDRSEQEAIDVLPEGVTEILHPKVHGPFIGGVDEGSTLTGLINNLFVAPMFLHEPETTDFIMILTPPGGASRPGQRESMGVILRDMPTSMYTVGQIEPRVRVNAPNSQGEKSFLNPFVSYQIARILNRTQIREGHGLRFDEIQDRVLPTYGLPANSLRQRLKHVALFDKTTQIWTTKPIGFEDYIGVDALAKSIAPEGISAFESACVARRRLMDIGIEQLTDKGANTVVSVGITMVYLAGQLNAAREFSRKMKKLSELSKTNKSMQPMQVKFYEKASEELEYYFKALKQKYEVAQFIYEELQLTPWNLTGEYLDVHKKGEGTGMMKLTGLGDPSGLGEGFSFIREVDAKPSKAVGPAIVNGPDLKKITGTEDDLRKLTMKQMAALLRSYGMAQKQIDTLKRWDRVHVIRDLSTKAASDGIGDGLERFARGEKMKLSEQKQIYSERIKVIWKRQIAALSSQGDRSLDVTGTDGDLADSDAAAAGPDAQAKAQEAEKDDSDDEEDDEDFAAELEDEMVDRTEANQLVVAHTRGSESEGGLGQIRNATRDQDLTKDARELAALKRQREEERVAKEGLKAKPAIDLSSSGIYTSDRKVIRRRITKTHPDGRQTTTFKFILHPDEVNRIMSNLEQEPESSRDKTIHFRYEYGVDEKPPGHAMFEDEDDFEFSSRGRLQGGRRKGTNRRNGSGGRGGVARARNLQIGKLKTKQSTEERMKKRKKEEDELDVYKSSAKRKGTNNRRERGSIRDRRAHVVFADKLEAIRQDVESRPSSGPFLKAVNRKQIPGYYEVISHPIDLATIRSKNADFQYRTADAFVREFEIMKGNAIKFNGPTNAIALEATAIHDFVKSQIESNRAEFTALEEEVEEIMSGNAAKKKKLKAGKSKKLSSGAGRNVATIGGMAVDLGDLSRLGEGSDDTDSDDSFELADNL